MADSSQPFVRAHRRQNVDINEVFGDGVKEHNTTRIARAADDAALISQVSGDLADSPEQSPFDGTASVEPYQKPTDDDFTSRLIEVGRESSEKSIDLAGSDAKDVSPFERETKLDTPIANEIVDLPDAVSALEPAAPDPTMADTPIAGTPAVLPGFDRATPLDQPSISVQDSNRETPADTPPPSAPVPAAPILVDRDTPLNHPIVSRFATDDETGLVAGAHKVEQFVPGPFAAGEDQLVAIASGLMGGLLPPGQQSVMVTSLRYGEGKTALAAGVALELARTPGQRVLLLDADLVRPRCDSFLGIEPHADLLDILSGHETPAQAITHSVADNLSVIANPGMQGGASDLLGARAMMELLDGLHQSFDVVVVDAPPLLIAPDAYTMMPRLGGVMLAVRAAQSGLDELRRIRRSLDTARARLLGTIMTYAPDSN